MQEDTFTTHTDPIIQLNAFRANDQVVLEKFYRDNYRKVAEFVKNNNGTQEDARDVYQESFIAVWRNIQLGKFYPEKENSLPGYLYRIAKNKWLDHLRSGYYKKTVAIKDNEPPELADKEEADATELEYISQVKRHFNELGANCREVLSRFYYKKESLRLIARAMNWTEATARNNKYRCIEKLRALLKKTIHNIE